MENFDSSDVKEDCFFLQGGARTVIKELVNDKASGTRSVIREF